MATPKTLSDSPKAKQPMGTEEGFESRAAGSTAQRKRLPTFLPSSMSMPATASVSLQIAPQGPSSIFWLAPREQGHRVGPRTQGREGEPPHTMTGTGLGWQGPDLLQQPARALQKKAKHKCREGIAPLLLGQGCPPWGLNPSPTPGLQAVAEPATSRLGDLRKPLALAFPSVS